MIESKLHSSSIFEERLQQFSHLLTRNKRPLLPVNKTERAPPFANKEEPSSFIHEHKESLFIF